MFGCKAFIHVLKEQKTKLDDKAILDYKFWDLEKRKVIRSRVVVFHEDRIMKDSNKEEQQLEKVLWM